MPCGSTPNWRESRNYIDLLRQFTRPCSPDEIDLDYFADGLEEVPARAIARLVEECALSQAGLHEVIEAVFASFELKKLLKNQGLPVSGTKGELVARLVAADEAAAAQLVAGRSFLKCTPYGLDMIAAFDAAKDQAREHAKHRSHEELLNGDIKEAYRIRLRWLRRYVRRDYEAETDRVRTLITIASSHPKILSYLPPQQLVQLQAALCMHVLWSKEDPLERWLPNDLQSTRYDAATMASFLSRHATFRQRIQEAPDFVQGFRLVFDPGDVDSCHLCTRLAGRVFSRETFPELPMEGCTSDTGCMCSVECVYSTSWSHVPRPSSSDGSLSPPELCLAQGVRSLPTYMPDDIVEKLELLRELLEEDLITQDEYENKKKELLSGM